MIKKFKTRGYCSAILIGLLFLGSESFAARTREKSIETSEAQSLYEKSTAFTSMQFEQKASANSEKDLYLRSKLNFDLSPNIWIGAALGASQNQSADTLNSDKAFFSNLDAIYSFGNLAFALKGLVEGSKNSETGNRQMGFYAGGSAAYFHIDSDEQDPKAQLTSSLLLLSNELYLQHVPPRERALFWARLTAYFGGLSDGALDTGTWSYVRFDGFYPLQKWTVLLGAYSSTFSIVGAGLERLAFDLWLHSQNLDATSSVRKPLLGGFGGAAFEITKQDVFVGKLGLRTFFESTDLGQTLEFAWQHFWLNHWNLNARYEISVSPTETISGISAGLSYSF